MPRTLAQNAQYIAETIKPAIKSAIEAQGVTVPSTDSFLDYADRIGEIEGGGSGYQLKDLPTGAISTVNDAAPLPLNALKVSVEAVQSGSGTPSPDNVRPISGWDSGEITADAGVNLLGSANDWNINASGKIVSSNSYSTYVAEVEQGKSYKFTEISELDILVCAFFESEPAINSVSYNQSRSVYEGFTSISFTAPITGYVAIRAGKTSGTDRKLMLAKIYTQQFPTTIYGAEWDVVNGELGLKITDGFYSSYNGEALPGIWMSDRDVYQAGTTPTIGAQVKYELATPTYVTLTGLSIRMLQGVNNVYADCGEVIEGEYFVDEGAIDVRKVDYQIGSSGSIKTTDGRVLSGFASMNGYHARPLDASGNWLDVDWSKSFEIGIAFKYAVADTNQTLFGSGIGNANYYKCPMIMLHPASQQFEIDISTTGNSWDMTMSQTVTYASLTINTWYFLKMTFNQNDMSLVIQISDDFSTWDTLLSITMSSAYYHDTASLCFGGFVQNSSFSSNNLLIDTFNTYIKGDGVNWGASTEAFPS